MRFAVLVMLAIGCYTAPDYNGTHFKCDGAHPCPDGQACVNGFCDGMGSNMPDAPANANGVNCGGPTCASNQKCCADFVSGVSCIAPSASCTGFAATCDGKEDCGTGFCCNNDGATIACAAACTGQVICREQADCPTNAPLCCPSVGTDEPWGRCNVACP